MIFHVRTQFDISPDERENERITDPNSIYFYSTKLPKELHMRYVRGMIKFNGGWERKLNVFVCEETMVLHASNDTLKIEGTLMFIPTIKPKSLLGRTAELVSTTGNVILQYLGMTG